MIVFAATGWLWVAGAAVGVGGWALWRGQRRQRGVPSVKLWRGLVDNRPGTRRRVVDPLWALVLAAGILAALALAGPAWRPGAHRPAGKLNVDWAVRSVRGAAQQTEHAEAWIHVAAADTTGVDTLLINGKGQPVSPAQLRAGVTADIAGERADLALVGGGTTLAAATFEKPPSDAGAFGLLHLNRSGTEIDHDLDRVFAIQPGARGDDPAALPRVILVKGLNPSAAELAGASLVVAEPDASLPGVTPGTRRVASANDAGWTPEVVESGNFAWPRFVSLKDVHIRAMRDATFSPEWQIVARANGRPWIAVRRESGLWIWLASEPATETDWAQAGAGFVAFFGEMQARATGAAGPVPFVVWTENVAPTSESRPAFSLNGMLGAAAILLLLNASVWHVARRGLITRLAGI